MPRSKARTARTLHGTRKWILKALQSSKGPEGMMTSEIKSSVNRLSGMTIPAYSVYAALRTMLRRKMVIARRRGREYQFRLVSTLPANVSAATAQPERSAAPASPPAPAVALPAMPVAPAPPVQHKLAPGEAVILHVGESHVETATNVHGKVVLERHRRPTA
jgi:hypothetical protein